MAEKTKLSVVMPSYNEEEAISGMIEGVKKHTSGFDTEIVVVDSSSDKTGDVARRLGARVIWQKPQGHGMALKAAIKEAKGDIIITTDCDNTYPMESVPALVGMIQNEGYDLISCCRMNDRLGREMPVANKFGPWLFAALARALYRIDTHDVTTGMFCMKRALAEKTVWENNYSLPCEIILRANLAGFKYKEVDIPYRIRTGVTTLNKWRSGKAYLKCLFKYRFHLNTDPKEL